MPVLRCLFLLQDCSIDTVYTGKTAYNMRIISFRNATEHKCLFPCNVYTHIYINPTMPTAENRSNKANIRFIFIDRLIIIQYNVCIRCVNRKKLWFMHFFIVHESGKRKGMVTNND